EKMTETLRSGAPAEADGMLPFDRDRHEQIPPQSLLDPGAGARRSPDRVRIDLGEGDLGDGAYGVIGEVGQDAEGFGEVSGKQNGQDLALAVPKIPIGAGPAL